MRIDNAHVFLFSVIFLLGNFFFVNCWESYELDLFDLVEEIGSTNFYDYFGVKQNADANEIRKAYRKLTLQWHPDKNSDPEAEAKFRHVIIFIFIKCFE
jgi:DnaJ family protein C protein 1